MPDRRWAKQCGARRKYDGQPCRQWSVSGGLRCRLHGGLSPQALRKAEVRIVGDSLQRQFTASLDSLHKRRIKWWTKRVVWLADVTGEDVVKLARKAGHPHDREQLWTMLPPDVEWPEGLRPEDEPKLRLDRRFGPRPSKPSEGSK